MNEEQNIIYRNILIDPLKECANYTPKFGHAKKGGFSLSDFQSLYGGDVFYKYLGLDTSLMYSAHKVAGGITSIYRQIGLGCERLVRKIFIDNLGLNDSDVTWSYIIKTETGKNRTLYLDGRIPLDKISDTTIKNRCELWKNNLCKSLGISTNISEVINLIVFEIRQGYKSKDSKRQNADIANASNAYANGYVPCLMVMSSQIDDDIVQRYKIAKWAILDGKINSSEVLSTYAFFNNIIGFNLIQFLQHNHNYFKETINSIVEYLLKAN